MQTEATVIAVQDQNATIQLNRKSACDGCHKQEDGKDCSVCSLLGGDRSFTASAWNAVGAEVGDKVAVETGGGRVLFYAALVFILPIAIALLAFGISSFLVDSLQRQLLIAFIAFALTFVGIWIYSERIRKNKHDIVIVSVLEKHQNGNI